jgi:hypothetical protein
MGTLHQNRKVIPIELKTENLKEGESVPVYTDRLTILKFRDKKDICLKSATNYDKIVPAGVRGQDMEKPKVAIGYTSRMGGVNLSDA